MVIKKMIFRVAITLILSTFFSFTVISASMDLDADPVPIVSSGSFICETWGGTTMDSFNVVGGTLTNASVSRSQGLVIYNLSGTCKEGETVSLDIAGSQWDMSQSMVGLDNNQIIMSVQYLNSSGNAIGDVINYDSDKSKSPSLSGSLSGKVPVGATKVVLKGTFTCTWASAYAASSETVGVYVNYAVGETAGGVKPKSDSIKTQVDTPEFGNSQEEDLTESDEENEDSEDSEIDPELVILNIPGPDNTIQTVVGTVVPGIGIIIIAILGTSTPPNPKPIKGPTGIDDGTQRTLKGKTDGREYNIKYNAEKDEWTNTETGNIFIPERFEGWQEDLAKDWKQSAKERERMSNRDTEFDRQVKDSIEKDKENAELLKKLHHLRRSLNLHRTEAGRINRPSGEPGSMTDKINDLEKQLINGEAVDKELLRKVRRVYTKASNGNISGYDDLPRNGIGKEIGETILLTEKEILSGSSKKALVLRGLLALASGGATEMGMEIASSGFVIKDYVDKGGDSVIEGMILGMGNAVISEGAGQITGGYAKVISKNASKAFHRLGGTSKEGYKIFKWINNAKNAKIKINGKETTIGLKDKMIDDIIENTAETVKNIYVAPPFQDIYKSYFN